MEDLLEASAAEKPAHDSPWNKGKLVVQSRLCGRATSGQSGPS